MRMASRRGEMNLDATDGDANIPDNGGARSAKIEGKLKTHFKVKIKDRVKIEEKKVTGEVV